jgi:uncharacterized protein (TIGR02246 family)
MKRTALLAVALLSPGLCTAEQAPASDADRQTIEAAYAAWARAADAKDMDTWLTFLAPDALFLPPDSPALDTRESIRQFYSRLFADPLFSIKCKGRKVDLSASREMAWSTGTCEATFSGPNGEASGASTKWLKVWRKQPDGQWKCAVNTWNSVGNGAEH